MEIEHGMVSCRMYDVGDMISISPDRRNSIGVSVTPAKPGASVPCRRRVRLRLRLRLLRYAVGCTDTATSLASWVTCRLSPASFRGGMDKHRELMLRRVPRAAQEARHDTLTTKCRRRWMTHDHPRTRAHGANAACDLERLRLRAVTRPHVTTRLTRLS